MGIDTCGCGCWPCLWFGLCALFNEFDEELLILLIEQTLDFRELNELGDDGGV